MFVSNSTVGIPEITHYCPKTPFLLVGTMIDLRDDAATVERLQLRATATIMFSHVVRLSRCTSNTAI